MVPPGPPQMISKRVTFGILSETPLSLDRLNLKSNPSIWEMLNGRSTLGFGQNSQHLINRPHPDFSCFQNSLFFINSLLDYVIESKVKEV